MRRTSRPALRAPRANGLTTLLAVGAIALSSACARAPSIAGGAIGPSPPPAPAAIGQPPSPNVAAADSMSHALRDTMQQLLGRAVRDSAFPGAFAIVGRHDGVLASVSAGRLDWAAAAASAYASPPDENTMWDIASLTKVVGLTTAMMQLVAAGRVELDAPVQRYLPEWSGPNKERVTVRHLLTHSAGLPAWRPLYKEATSPESALALVYATPLDTVPGARYVYSDIGAILAGQVVERVTGERLDRYLQARVFVPLGMTSTVYRPDESLRPRIAPTEVDPWRQRHLRGEVHDENAFALGGVSSHAGLFSTGRDLARFARMYLNGGSLDGARILDPAVIEAFTRVQDGALSHRALGWETPSGSNSAGRLMSPRAFGHTGFTGTSFWVDPANDVFVILLTNRVNPTRQNLRITHVRPALADAVMTLLREAAAPSSASPSPSSSPAAPRP